MSQWSYLLCVAAPVAGVLGVCMVWVLTVMDQVEAIRSGRLRVDDEDVIGAARWWVTGSVRP